MSALVKAVLLLRYAKPLIAMMSTSWVPAVGGALDRNGNAEFILTTFLRTGV